MSPGYDPILILLGAVNRPAIYPGFDLSVNHSVRTQMKQFVHEFFRRAADAVALAGPQGLTVRAAAIAASHNGESPCDSTVKWLLEQFRSRSPRLFELHGGEDNDEVSVLACEELRKYALGWSPVEHQILSEVAWKILVAVGRHGRNGVLQADLAKELDMSPRNIHHYIMTVVASELVGRIRMVAHTDDGSRVNNSAFILLTRFAIERSRAEEKEARRYAGSGQKHIYQEQTVPDVNLATEGSTEDIASLSTFAVDANEKLPLESQHDMERIKRALFLFQESKSHVIAQSDLKLLVFPDKDRPPDMTVRSYDKKRHRLYRRLREKMLRLGLVKETILPAKDSLGVFRGDIPCLKLVSNALNVKEKSCKLESVTPSDDLASPTRLLVEPDLGQQIYDLLAESGEKGITAHELTTALGPQVGTKRVARFIKAISMIHNVKAIHRFEGRTLVKPLALVRNSAKDTVQVENTEVADSRQTSAMESTKSEGELQRDTKSQALEGRNVLSVQREAMIKEWIVSRRVLQMDKIGRELAAAEDAPYPRVDSRVLRRIFDRLVVAGFCKILHVAHPSSPSSNPLKLLVAADVTLSSTEVQNFLKKASFSNPPVSHSGRKLFRGKQSKAIDSQLIRALQVTSGGTDKDRETSENVLRKRRDRRPADLILCNISDQDAPEGERDDPSSFGAKSADRSSKDKEGSEFTSEILLTDAQCAVNYSESDRRIGKVIALEYGFIKSVMQRTLMLHKCIYEFLNGEKLDESQEGESHQTCRVGIILSLPPIGEFRFQEFLDNLDLGTYAEIFGVHADIGAMDEKVRSSSLREIGGKLRSKCLNNQSSVHNMRKSLEILMKMGLVRPTAKNTWMLTGGGLFLDFGLGLPLRRARGIAFKNVSDVDYFWEEVENRYTRKGLENDHNATPKNASLEGIANDGQEISSNDEDPQTVPSVLGGDALGILSSATRSKFTIKQLYSPQHWKASRLSSVSERNAAIIEAAFQSVIQKQDPEGSDEPDPSADVELKRSMWKQPLSPISRKLLYGIYRRINRPDVSLEQVFLYYNIRRRSRMPIAIEIRLRRYSSSWKDLFDAEPWADRDANDKELGRPLKRRRRSAQEVRYQRILPAAPKSFGLPGIFGLLSHGLNVVNSAGNSSDDKKHGVSETNRKGLKKGDRRTWAAFCSNHAGAEQYFPFLCSLFLTDVAKVKGLMCESDEGYVLTPPLWRSIARRYKEGVRDCQDLLTRLLELPLVPKAMSDASHRIKSLLETHRDKCSILSSAIPPKRENLLDRDLMQSFADVLNTGNSGMEHEWPALPRCLQFSAIRYPGAEWPAFTLPSAFSFENMKQDDLESSRQGTIEMTGMERLNAVIGDLIQEILKIVFGESRRTYRPLAAMRILTRLEPDHVKIAQADLRDRNMIRYTRSDKWKRLYQPSLRLTRSVEDTVFSQFFFDTLNSTFMSSRCGKVSGDGLWKEVCNMSEASGPVLASTLHNAGLGPSSNIEFHMKISPAVPSGLIETEAGIGEKPLDAPGGHSGLISTNQLFDISQWSVQAESMTQLEGETRASSSGEEPKIRVLDCMANTKTLQGTRSSGTDGEQTLYEYWEDKESSNLDTLLSPINDDRARRIKLVYSVVQGSGDEGIPASEIWKKCLEISLDELIDSIHNLIKFKVIHRFALRDHSNHLSGGGAVYMCLSRSMKYSFSPYSLKDDPMNLTFQASDAVPLMPWILLNGNADSRSFASAERRILSAIIRMPGIEERRLMLLLSNTDVPRRALLDVCAALEFYGCIRTCTTEVSTSTQVSLLHPVPIYPSAHRDFSRMRVPYRFVDELELGGKGKCLKTYYFPGSNLLGPLPTVNDVQNVALLGLESTTNGR